uniref:Peripheral-type benzodiazepine receptor-associated protein 1 n=1 Tax=Varanus komodoensis TaxID=61221 RepID=A0A8D2J568_VARKO
MAGRGKGRGLERRGPSVPRPRPGGGWRPLARPSRPPASPAHAMTKDGPSAGGPPPPAGASRGPPLSSSGSGQESVPPAATQQQGWLASSSYSQLVKQNTELLKALLDLEQRCTHLKEENILLRKSSFPEMKEKVKRLKRKNGELADIAKRLEERAKKLQESSLKVGSAPIPLTMTCSDMNLYKTTFARQRAKDLSEQASALLAKDQQLEALQRECWELRAKLTTGKERTYLFSINDFDRLLRESQREETPSTIHKFVEKCKQCENLKHEMEKKQKTSDDLELQLNEVLSENVRFAEENSQLHEKTERTQKIENENAELKIKLLQATEDRNSAIQFTKGLEIKVENLEHVIRNMKEIAERQQQLESEHKETLLVLKNKEEEIQHLQQIQAEIKREHEESVQILESQVRELENQYHSQTEHFNLLSQELERLQIKKSGILESEVSQTTCNSSVTICPEKLEQETHHNFHCNKDIINKDSASIGTAGLLKKADQLESQVNSSGSLQNSSKCCLNSEEEKPDEVALETDKVSINLQLENQVSSKLHVFLARYSYDPFAGPNKNPEVELPLTAGEYVYIYGGMDEDGFYEGELMDEPPDAPLDVQVQPSSSAGFLVITWLPVTIDAVGSSNGVKVIGYAVYINGQKVTESMSPTSGNVLLAVSQLHTFQETLKVSVRTLQESFAQKTMHVCDCVHMRICSIPVRIV